MIKMTKKNEKIINTIISRIPKEQFRKGYIVNGKFVITNGYMLLVSDEVPNVPLHYEDADISYLLKLQEEVQRSQVVDVRYSADVIKKWYRRNERKPYYIGVEKKSERLVKYSIGIDPLFLSAAMELTKTRTIHVADSYCRSLMIEGNGMTMYVMPILTPAEKAEETIIEEV